MIHFLLGLDISTTCTGWALLPVREKLDSGLKCGKIVTEWDGTPESHIPRVLDRVRLLLRKLNERVVVPYALNIVAVGVEQMNFFRGGSTIRDLCGVSYIAQHYLYERLSIEPNQINTATAKAAMAHAVGWKRTNPRKGPDKSDMVKMANKKFSLNLNYVVPTKDQITVNKIKVSKHTSDDDVADALAVALALRNEIGVDLVEKLYVKNQNELP